MDWPRYRRDAVAFPTPRRDVYYPHLYPNQRYLPYHLPEREAREDRPWRKVDAISDFLDDKIAYSGDLGWTLDYATAWCYRHLIGSQPEVADAIDHVRELETVSPKTPYYIFDYLDKAIFGGKLQDMVYLRWRCQSTCSTGTTSAPNVEGIPRICMELNMTPFEDDEAGIDDLLEALIHQMIHAYFLVCCGAQKKGDHQDGRLMDGLHFGVILLTIKDISKQCVDGPLDLIFHAYKRRQYEGRLPLIPASHLVNHRTPASKNKNSYISLDPRGSAVGPAAADGQTHCMHDNRKISWQQIKNWQVETYARAIDLHIDLKGIEIWDLDADGVLIQHSRLHVDPSTTYVELLWDDKRIMVPRAKCMMFPSLERPITKLGQFDLMIPRCDFATFKCVDDFIQLENYRTSDYDLVRKGSRVLKGPPVYIPQDDTSPPSGSLPSIIANIKVFKAAESMKFDEMQHHAMEKLWSAEMTGDDPIDAFVILYNDDEHSKKPIHSELHKWARKFMVKKDDGVSSADDQSLWRRIHVDPFFDMDPYAALYQGRHGHGISNYEKICTYHGPAFEDLYSRNRAFQDDAQIVRNELILSGDIAHDGLHSSDLTSPLSDLSGLDLVRPALHRPHGRSWSSHRGLMGAARPFPHRQHSWDDLAMPYNHRRRMAIPRLLPRGIAGLGEKGLRRPAHPWRQDLGLLGIPHL